MKNGTLDFIATLLICFVLLWLTIGLWACATKIKEHEKWHEEHAALYSQVESPDNKLLLMAMRCHKMEQENDMLRIRLEDLEIAFMMATNKPPCKIPGAVDDLIQ